MNKKTFVIYDTDENYSRRLWEYLQSRLKDSHEILLFTERKALAEYLSTARADVLLSAEEIPEGVKEDSVACYVRLSEIRPAEETEAAVYKFSSADSLLREVMSFCAAGTAADTGFSRTGEPMEVIGIYSPVKRCFQTTFAVTLGQIRAKKGKTLYLNFESFSGFDILEGKKQKTDLMDLLYFSECGTGSFEYRVSSLAEQIGELDYIPPARMYTRYRDVDKCQWLKLIERIRTETCYECLILDLSEQVAGLFEVLKECDRVYSMVGSDGSASAKFAQYEALLSEAGCKEVIDKTMRIEMPKFKEIPDNFAMLPYSELADYIKKLVNEQDADK
ncbi:MAG: hypothetical protein K6E32_00815 [Lachnospiraceae bacterium]|nr:hypothetical protein [Lachnospiraceae bacterium]